METKDLASKAGLVGMVGAALWIISLLIQYGFDLQPPNAEGSFFVANQVLAFIALSAFAIGYLGIYWGDGINGRFGRISTGLVATGYLLIIIGGIFVLILGEDESPIFLLFPIGAFLIDIGVLLTGIGVAHASNWTGWQRWMPLLYAAFLWLVIEIPFIAGVYPDGPGLIPELFQGIGLFLVALATYTASAKKSAVTLSTA